MPLGDREAIAVYTDYDINLQNFQFQSSLDSSIVKALDSRARGPGFRSRPGQWNSIKNYKILFLIEDISELEC